MNAWFDFCVEIPDPPPEEKAWLAAQFDLIPAGKNINEDGDSDEDPEPTYGPITALEYGMRQEEVSCHDISFHIARQRDGSEQIVLSNSGDGSGETDVLQHLLQAFTAAFPQRPPIELEWACSADRHVPGIYGGGATLFYQGEAHWFNTTRYLRLANDRIDRRTRRFDHLPIDLKRYYLRYVSFTSENLEKLTTSCDGTIGEAIEDAAEEHARAKLAELTEYKDKDDWIVYYGRISCSMGIATIAIALEPKLDIPVPPSAYDVILITD